MTASTVNVVRQHKKLTGRQKYPIAAGANIPQGVLVAVNSSGFAVNGADTAGLKIVGVSDEAYDNSAGSNGAAHIAVVTGVFLFTFSSITQAMLNTSPAMYVVDNDTLDDAAGPTNDVFAGILVEYVSSTQGWVWILGAEAEALSGITATASEINRIDASNADGAMLSFQDTQLTAAQVKALAAANITVVSAPGAGLAAVPVAVHLFLDHGGTDFVQTNGSDHLALKYAGGAEISELGTEAQCTALLEASADAALYVNLEADCVPVANTAIALDNNGAAEYTTGDGTLSVRVYYRTVPMAAFT